MLRRIPDVEKEIDDLDSDDERQGWMEALETEWSSLQHREGMCQEEIRGKKYQLAELEEKIEAYVVRAFQSNVQLIHIKRIGTTWKSRNLRWI